jgi:YHS domain-containing protein
MFAPLEYLVGRWHGQGTPKDHSAQQFRGWPETHTWAWSFSQGTIVGMSLAVDGGRLLSRGTLTFDPARRCFRLEAAAAKPGQPPLSLEGAIDQSGKVLVLETSGKPTPASDRIRLSIRPNANFIRYTLNEDHLTPGAVQFSRTAEVGLTKEGESLAGSTTVSERPRCIVTGGSATMSVTYQGQTYPICCTGCRDEFNENPEKYLKKAALLSRARAANRAASGRSTRSQISRFEDAFAGDVAAGKAGMPASADKRGGPDKRVDARSKPQGAADTLETKPGGTTASSKSSSKTRSAKSAADQAARAATLLRLGQNLEKSGKTQAALEQYQRIARDFPNTPAAKRASQRAKELAQ